MNPFDDLIARATAKLSMDGELKLEIGRELRGHLEDSAAEYEAAGYAAEQAAEEAVKHLGDPGELAEELWRANRGRLRVRAVAKWAAQILLVPAAVVVAMIVLARPWFSMNMLVFTGILTNPVAVLPTMIHLVPLPVVFEAVVDDPEAPFSSRQMAELSDDQRWVLLGDPKAKDDFERARSIVDRWPDNPVYYGDFVGWATMRYREAVESGRDEDEAARQEYLAILDRGERIEPDNGQYALLRAATMLERAGELVNPVTQPSTTASATQASFEPRTFGRLDEEAMDQVMAELRRAVSKSRMTSHAVDMVELRLAMVRGPRDLSEYLRGLASLIGTILPELGPVRRIAVTAGAYAWRLAEEGKVERAERVLHDMALLGSLQGVGSRCLIELLVAQSISQLAAQYQTAIAERYGSAAQIAQARAKEDEVMSISRDIRTRREAVNIDYHRRAGMTYGMLVAHIPDFTPDPSPVSRAEQAAFEQMGFGLLLMAVSGVLVPAGLLALLAAMIGRSGWGGVTLFVGWGRLGRIVGWGVLAPTLAYGVYSLLPAANREFGLNYMSERFVVEWLALALAMGMVMTWQIRRALAERAGEFGLTMGVGQSPAWRWGWTVAIVALAISGVVYVGAWQIDSLRPRVVGVGSCSGELRFERSWLTFVGDALVVAYGLPLAVGGLWMMGRLALLFKRDRAAALTVVRSLTPILAAIVIVWGFGGHLVLSQVEAAAMLSIRGARDMTMFHEIDGSAYRRMREWHVRRLEELRAGEGAGQINVPPGGAGG